MVCYICGTDTLVVNSRLQKRGNSVWRRRKCQKCGALWTTQERSELATLWRINKNEQITNFCYETLYISLYEVLKHKKTAPLDAKYICETVIQKLAAKKRTTITTTEIYDASYNILRRYDKVASALYKALHVN